MDWKESIQYAAHTDVGMRRSNNQDSHAVVLADSEETWSQRGHVFLVADGMGGHAGGELASKLAAEGVPHKYFKYRELAPPEALLKSVQETNAEVNKRGMGNPDFRDMGTTMTSLVVLPQGALVAHIGDSRLYRFRGESLQQLTFDHSVDWELRASGQLKEGSDLAAFVPKNQITRSLGPNPTVEVDLEGPYPLEVGDTYMSCSDGLVRKVDDDEIAAILATHTPTEAAKTLVDLANLRGGPDNITVIVVRVAGAAAAASARGPLAIKSEGKPQPVHPLFWLIPVVCLLVGLILAITTSLTAGAIVAATGLIGIGVAFMQGGAAAGRVLPPGQRLGRGPYTDTKLPDPAKFLAKLFQITDDLRSMSQNGDWSGTWKKFDLMRQLAEQSLAKGDWQNATRQATRALSFLLDEWRAIKEKKASDSTIEY